MTQLFPHFIYNFLNLTTLLFNSVHVHSTFLSVESLSVSLTLNFLQYYSSSIDLPTKFKHSYITTPNGSQDIHYHQHIQDYNDITYTYTLILPVLTFSQGFPYS